MPTAPAPAPVDPTTTPSRPDPRPIDPIIPWRTPREVPPRGPRPPAPGKPSNWFSLLGVGFDSPHWVAELDPRAIWQGVSAVQEKRRRRWKTYSDGQAAFVRLSRDCAFLLGCWFSGPTWCLWGYFFFYAVPWLLLIVARNSFSTRILSWRMRCM